jgi:D-serine deaminase-like pyridoxal phosphate-dependent protein
MKMSRGMSPMKVAKAECGSKKNTKAGVYADLDAYMVALGFESKPLVK